MIDSDTPVVSLEGKRLRPMPMFLRLSEAEWMLRMSRSAAYEAMKTGALPACAHRRQMEDTARCA